MAWISWQNGTFIVARVCLVACIVSFTNGCGETPSGTSSAPTTSSSGSSSPPPPSSGDTNFDSFSFAPSQPPAPPTNAADGVPGTSESTAPTAPPSRTDKVIAEAGVGKKGRGYGGGMISEPAKQYFRIRERIIFQIQIPDALKKFRALDPDGKPPASHEVFMKEVVEKLNIQLPDLPAGEEYWYDTEQGELMVLRPK